MIEMKKKGQTSPVHFRKCSIRASSIHALLDQIFAFGLKNHTDGSLDQAGSYHMRQNRRITIKGKYKLSIADVFSGRSDSN